MLGAMHLAGKSYAGKLENPRGPKWWGAAAREVAPFLDDVRRALLASELEYQERTAAWICRAARCMPTCSATTCCSKASGIGGVIDFYFAGIDALLFDRRGDGERLVRRPGG